MRASQTPLLSTKSRYLTVLCGPHRPRIYVHIWINLDRSDLQAGRLQQEPGGRRCDNFP